MKTTRLLIPVMALAASTLLMAQVTPGQPPKREPAPVPVEPAPPPTPIPAEPEAFPVPGDPLPRHRRCNWPTGAQGFVRV